MNPLPITTRPLLDYQKWLCSILRANFQTMVNEYKVLRKGDNPFLAEIKMLEIEHSIINIRQVSMDINLDGLADEMESDLMSEVR